MSTSFANSVDDTDPTKAQDPANAKHATDARQELRSILQKMLLENLDAQMKQAIENSQSDPTALTRYKALYERRKQIGNASAPSP
jgi:uncharacterized membrane protein YcjF (UPF0283 family)